MVEGEPREALRALDALAVDFPDDPRLHRGYGIAYERLGDQARARAAFARFLELAPGHPAAARIRRRQGL